MLENDLTQAPCGPPCACIILGTVGNGRQKTGIIPVLTLQKYIRVPETSPKRQNRAGIQTSVYTQGKRKWPGDKVASGKKFLRLLVLTFSRAEQMGI